MEFHAGENFDQPNFPGAAYVRPTTGADVRAGDGHDAHLTGQLLLAAVGDGLQRLGIRGCNFNRNVFPDPLVGFGLDGGQVLLRQHTGKINGHKIRAHVEADIFIAEAAVYHAGENVLAGMQLHEFEPALIIDLPIDGLPHGKRLFTEVDDLTAALMRVGHADTGQKAGVARLAAALRIKAGSVQHDIIAVLSRLTGYNARFKRCLMRVLIIELFCCHFDTSCQIFNYHSTQSVKIPLEFVRILVDKPGKSTYYISWAISKAPDILKQKGGRTNGRRK